MGYAIKRKIEGLNPKNRQCQAVGMAKTILVKIIECKVSGGRTVNEERERHSRAWVPCPRKSLGKGS